MSKSDRERAIKWKSWLADQCRGAGTTDLEREVLTRRMVMRHDFHAIAHRLRISQREAQAAYERAENLIVQTPGFWEGAREFERQIVQVAANKNDFDDRPEDMRGVTPDRSSQRFQGGPVISRDDARVKQSRRDAGRMWVVRETASL